MSQVMFGKPEWFKEKVWGGWGITPATWQGWAYAAAWAAITFIPFAGFQFADRQPEALIWFAAMVVALGWDVRKIVAAKHPKPVEDVLYIGDDDDSIQTSKLDLRLRR
jgi:hypothetical protein